LGLEGLKAAGAVTIFPAAEGGDADLAAIGVGNVIEDGGQIAPHLLFGPGRGFPHNGQNEGVAKERNFGPALFSLGWVGHRIDLLHIRVETSITANGRQRQGKTLLV
jgi:hypothetical protein